MLAKRVSDARTGSKFHAVLKNRHFIAYIHWSSKYNVAGAQIKRLVRFFVCIGQITAVLVVALTPCPMGGMITY